MAKPEHEVAYQDINILISKHAASLSALELLAVASNLVGKLVAFQDQRITTPEQAMQIVGANIEHGNEQAVAKLSRTKGRA